MTSKFEFPSSGSTPSFPEFDDLSMRFDVPTRRDVLPSGMAVVVVGNTSRWGKIDPVQGRTSSAACCQRVVRVLRPEYAAVPSGEFSVCGLIECLSKHAVQASSEQAQSPEDLAQGVEAGRAVLALVNPGVLWGHPAAVGHGGPTHVVQVTATVRELASGDLAGVYVNDPAQGDELFVDLPRFLRAWLETGGGMISAASNEPASKPAK